MIIFRKNKKATLIAEHLFNEIIKADPDIHKKNSQWLLNIILGHNSLLEDLPKATGYLQVFDRVKRQMPAEKRDLNKYKSFSELYLAIKPYEQSQTQGQIDRELDKKMHEQAKVLFNDAKYNIVIPLTKDASCYFGKNTQWCTAATKNNYFHTYNEEGPLYIILDKANNERWQYHFATGQFMDENDSSVDVQQFVSQHPTLTEILKESLPKPIDDIQKRDGSYCPIYEIDPKNGEIHYLVKDGGYLPGHSLFSFSVMDSKLKFFPSDTSSFSFKNIVEMLNKLKIGYDGYRVNDKLFFANEKWKTLSEVMDEKEIEFDNGWWWAKSKHYVNMFILRIPSTITKNVLRFSRQNLNFIDENYLCKVSIAPNTAEFSVDEMAGNVANIGGYIVALLLKKPVKAWYRESVYQSEMIPSEYIKPLVEKKPWLVDLPRLYKFTGVSKYTKLAVEKLLSSAGIQYGDWINSPILKEEQLVIQSWPNLNEFVKEIDRTGYFKVELGKVLRTADILDFLKYLNKLQPKLLNRYVEHLHKTVKIVNDYKAVLTYMRNNSDPIIKKAYAVGMEFKIQDELINIINENEYIHFRQNGKIVYPSDINQAKNIEVVCTVSVQNIIYNSNEVMLGRYILTKPRSTINLGDVFRVYMDHNSDYEVAAKKLSELI